MAKHDLSNDEAGALFGVDRRTIGRWLQAEAASGGGSVVNDTTRLLLGAYNSGIETPRMKLVFWVHEARREPRKYLPFDGEESWILIPAEKISGVRFGPSVEIAPLPPMAFGIKWFRDRLEGLEALQEEGGVEGDDARRLSKIIIRYRKFIADFDAAFPAGKRGPRKGSQRKKV